MIPISQILIAPIVTEKTLATEGKYAFKVNSAASKQEIKTAIKHFYKLEADTVNVINLPAKYRQRGNKITTRRRSYRKAVVTIKGNKKLNFNDLA